MKKIALFALITLIMSGTTLAYTEHFDDGFINPVVPKAKEVARERLLKSIQQRRLRYIREKLRTVDNFQNRNLQRRRHEMMKVHNNVGGVATQMKRKGALKFVPYYSYRKERTDGNYIRPNAKQVFKRRAINYYREGGYAGKRELKENVVYGSTHRVNIIPSSWFKRNAQIEAVMQDIRDAQRNIGKSEQVPTGYQKTTLRRGSSLRNFMSPYQPIR